MSPDDPRRSRAVTRKAPARRKARPIHSAKTRGDPDFPSFRVEDSPFYLIARTNGHYVLDMERALKKIGMDLPRWRTLMLVHERNPSSISEIAERAVIRLSTMTKVAQRLEKEGLVKLATRRTDGRTTDVHITAKGEDAVVQVRRVASRIYRMGFHDFSSNDIVVLNTLLRRVFKNLAPPLFGVD